MERISSMAVFMALFVACMLHASSAQTTHVVGDGMGWIVPPGGDVAYRTWAASQTFSVGDVLVFNYATGMHDVAEVNREAHDSCNFTSPISMNTDGPTNITLTSAGEHYFICTISRHCSFGQRLAINVSTASPVSPPQSSPPSATTPGMAPPPAVPTTPSPTTAPAPSPSMGPTTHIVGDSMGWTVPPGGPVAYETWAMGRRFTVGDTLVFNFTTGQHDVAVVTRAEYNSCNTTSTNIIMTGPASIRLTSPGEHYYICTIGQHCSFGQLLAINVTGGNSVAMPPAGSNGPSMQPNNPTTPTTGSNASPPQSNSATSFTTAVLPFTFLAIASAFLFI